MIIIKRAVNFIVILSLVALVLGVFLLLLGYAVQGWVWAMWGFLVIPVFGKSLSLAGNINKVKPSTWLIIYVILAFVYIIGLITSVLFGFPFEVSLF